MDALWQYVPTDHNSMYNPPVRSRVVAAFFALSDTEVQNLAKAYNEDES